jgi:hypothetical protein
MEKHKLFCILGRTGSGKSTLARLAAKKMNMNVLQSYTTRSPRPSEQENINDCDHIFIHPDSVNAYQDDMVAYTERVEYCSFMTKGQVLNNDICIINPVGLYELILKTKNLALEIIPIFVTVPYQKNLEQAKKRGSLLEWKENYEKEEKEFRDFFHSGMIRYRVLNNTTVEEGVKKMEEIFAKERA